MSFIDDSEQNVNRLMETTAGGGVSGFVGRSGMGIDDLFAGSFHPDSGQGSKNLELLKKQTEDRKKQRAEMEKQAAKDGIELVGIPSPMGGYFDVNTEFALLAYDELSEINQQNLEYNEIMTPSAETEWVEVDTNLEYDEPGEGFSFQTPIYDQQKPEYAGENFINKSEKNWEIIKGI